MKASFLDFTWRFCSFSQDHSTQGSRSASIYFGINQKLRKSSTVQLHHTKLLLVEFELNAWSLYKVSFLSLETVLKRKTEVAMMSFHKVTMRKYQ